MRAYSDPKREMDPYALPDVEVWRTQVYLVQCRCGEYEIPEPVSFENVRCPSCERKPETCGGVSTPGGKPKLAWFWWSCFPGCLPDSDPFGPFDSEEAALRDAQGDDDDDRIHWTAGAQLILRAHHSEPGKGLSYIGGVVVAAEPGASGGWDVYDAEDGSRFYGFSVEGFA